MRKTHVLKPNTGVPVTGCGRVVREGHAFRIAGAAELPTCEGCLAWLAREAK